MIIFNLKITIFLRRTQKTKRGYKTIVYKTKTLKYDIRIFILL